VIPEPQRFTAISKKEIVFYGVSLHANYQAGKKRYGIIKID
jgi:hypothetical protein